MSERCCKKYDWGLHKCYNTTDRKLTEELWKFLLHLRVETKKQKEKRLANGEESSYADEDQPRLFGPGNLTSTAGGYWNIENPGSLFYILAKFPEDSDSKWNLNYHFYYSELPNPDRCRLFFDIDSDENWVDEYLETVKEKIVEMVKELYVVKEVKLNIAVSDKFPKRKVHIVLPEICITATERKYITSKLKEEFPKFGFDNGANGLRILRAYKFDRETRLSNIDKGRYFPLDCFGEDGKIRIDITHKEWMTYYRDFSLLVLPEEKKVRGYYTPLTELKGEHLDIRERHFAKLEEKKQKTYEKIELDDKWRIPIEKHIEGMYKIAGQREPSIYALDRLDDFKGCIVCDREHTNNFWVSVIITKTGYNIGCKRDVDENEDKRRIRVKLFSTRLLSKPEPKEEKKEEIPENEQDEDEDEDEEDTDEDEEDEDEDEDEEEGKKDTYFGYKEMKPEEKEAWKAKQALIAARQIKTLYQLYENKNFEFKIFPESDRRVHPISTEGFEGDKKVLLIKISCGGGKTHQIIDYIKNNPEQCEKVLWITPRISLANDVTQRTREILHKTMGFHHYKKGVEKRKLVPKRLICQVESLHKFKSGKFDIIVCDEAESALCQLTSAQTNKNLVKNQQVFKDFLLKSKFIVFADAFLSDKTVRLLSSFELKGEIHKYEMKPERRVAYQFPDITKDKKRIGKNAFIQCILDDLSQGKKIFFVSASRTFKNSIIAQIDEFNAENPGIQIKYIHYDRKNRLEEGVDVMKEWITYEIVLTTTTIQSGVNFDKEYFDCAYVYLSSAVSIPARDMFQSLNRVRQIKTNTVYWFLNKQRSNISAMTSYSQILRMYYERNEYRQDMVDAYRKAILGPEFKEEKIPQMTKEMAELYARNELERGLSVANMEESWSSILTSENYELREYEIDFEVKDLDLQVEEEIYLPYDDVETLTGEKARPLLFKENKTDEEELQVMKYKFDQTIKCHNKEKREDFWYMYCKSRDVRAKIKNLSYEKGINEGTFEIIDYMRFTETPKETIQCDMLSSKLQIMNELSQFLELEGILKPKKNILKKKLVDNKDYIEGLVERICLTSNRKMTGKKSTYQGQKAIINSFLSSFCNMQIIAQGKSDKYVEYKKARMKIPRREEGDNDLLADCYKYIIPAGYRKEKPILRENPLLKKLGPGFFDDE